jgi:hypothetical protein
MAGLPVRKFRLHGFNDEILETAETKINEEQESLES